jgi:hypothetical protein
VVFEPEAVLQPKAFRGQQPPLVLDSIPVGGSPVIMPNVALSAATLESPDRVLEPSSETLELSSQPELSCDALGPRTDTPSHPETFADRLADLADRLHGERIPCSAPRIFQESEAPGPRTESAGRTPLILDVTFQREHGANGTPARALLAAPPSRLLLAEPEPPCIAREMPIEAFTPCATGSAQQAPNVSEAEPCAGSPVRLPDPPDRPAAPSLARFQSYHEAAGRLMRPMNFATPALSATALPKITLPGPALPRELMSLQAAGLVPIRIGVRKGPANRFGWLTYITVAMILTAGVGTFTILPRTASTAPPRPTPQPAPDPPVSARATNSLARFVEVTGIRFMEVNKKPQIHYLVVNHSSAPMSSVTVYVTLRATNAKAGQPPIARLNFRSPPLQAFEAKEMFSSIERASASLDLPDWQDLHADVEVQ